MGSFLRLGPARCRRRRRAAVAERRHRHPSHGGRDERLEHIAALLAAHAAETRLEDRVAAARGAPIVEKMAEAAEAASSAAASARQSAAEAAQLVKSAGEAVETAACGGCEAKLVGALSGRRHPDLLAEH